MRTRRQSRAAEYGNGDDAAAPTLKVKTTSKQAADAATPRSPRRRQSAAAVAKQAFTHDADATPRSPRRRSTAAGAAVNGAPHASSKSKDAAAPPVLLHASLPGQHPLLLPSPAALELFIAPPLLLWWLCVLSGILLHRGLPAALGRRPTHPLIAYDRYILRRAGALIPFAALAARVLVDLLAPPAAAAIGGAAGRTRQHKTAQQRRWRLATSAWSCLWLYVLMAAARALLSTAHWRAMRASLLAEHLVSDHLFLGGTVLACLQSEAAALLSDWLRGGDGRGGGGARRVLLIMVAALDAALYVATALDMHYTARFYHHRIESFATAAAVWLLFQAPLVKYLRTACRFPSSSAAGASGAGGRGTGRGAGASGSKQLAAVA